MYAVYVIIYVLKIGKRFFRMFENWFLECDEDMQTTCIHATGCVKITSHDDSNLITKNKNVQHDNISVDNFEYLLACNLIQRYWIK